MNSNLGLPFYKRSVRVRFMVILIIITLLTPQAERKVIEGCNRTLVNFHIRWLERNQR
jgi:hypothetical protein